MNRWSDRRVTLIGDAGYFPGPAVGGGTSVAVIGAYLLADALRAEDDPRRAFDRYENAIREMVTRSRRVGPTTMKTLIPATARQAWLTVQSMRLIPRLPPAAQRRLFALQAAPRHRPGSNRACGSPAHGSPTSFTGGVRPEPARPGWAGVRRRCH